MEENYGHKPVLLHECLGALAIKPDGIYVDGTLGRAGHSLEIVRRLTTGRLIALDRDETAIEAANRRLGDYLDKVTLVHSNFSALDAVLHELGVHGVDGMLFDLGVSSPQLDEAQRGFSYKQDAPLDMRMDESAALTAREVVNTYSYEELRRILFEYGEERYAPAIAKRICQHREQKPIETTLELADIIRSAMPASALREKQHPAKRSFQAIRIAVNDELGELPPMLPFGLNSAAYVAEIVRSGIMAVDIGQFEAGRSLGLNYRQTMTTIILPQAVKNILPALCNEFISLLKETSISGYIGLMDLTKGGDIIRSVTYEAFMPLIAVAVIYLLMVVGLSKAVGVLERKLRNNER